ncbi:hypothetical protein QTP86_021725, partial [Hemibagrus guttatus]
GEVDGGSSLLKEDLSSHEHIQAWLRHRRLQHILQLGHSSVKGLKVKVFRPDSKPHWLHGIVSHHDHNSRTMTVLSDQVAEPLSVDPALMHVLVLDDINQLLLVKDNAATNCKPHTNKISRINMLLIFLQNAGNGSKNTTETEQVCSSGPVQRKQPELCRENSNCSLTEDDTDRMREDNRADEARADFSKSRINHSERKRRKAGDKEEQDEKDSRSAGLKRPKGNSGSDQTEGSDSEGTIIDTKSLQRKCSKKPADCKTGNNPATHLGHDLKAHSSPKSIELSSCQLAEIERQKVGKVMPLHTSTPCNGVYQTVNSLHCTMVLGCNKAAMEQGDGMMEMEDQSEGTSQEDCEAVSALLASQEDEQLVSLETACVLLHTSPPACEGVEGEQEIPPGEPAVRTSDLTCPEVIAPSCDSADAMEVKSIQSPGATSPRHDDALASEITHKTTVSPCSSLEVISKPPEVLEVARLKCSSSPQAVKIEESSLPSKVNTDKVLSGFKSTHGSKVTPTPTLHQQNAPSPSTTDTQTQSRTPPQNVAHNLNHTPISDKPMKSPLIVDRNEPFTVYRDPALVRRELESLSTYVQHPHTPPSLQSKHHLKSSSPSSSSPSLTSTTSHTKIMSPTAHLSPLPLPSQSPLCSTHPSIPHPHLLPSLLPGLPPSSALLAGHARLGSLGLPPHPLALQATQSLLSQSPGTASLAPMGLYPVLWPPFPSGVHSYGLGIPGSKWAPSETAGMSEVSLRRNTPSPWVPQTTPVTNAESQGLRPPLPVRPSSTEPQRPSRSSQPSTPTTKSTEEQERKAFTETQSSVPLKVEQERMRAVVGKNGHISHSTVTESPSAHSKQPQLVYDLTGDRTSCYQEESRRILQESIEVAPFTAKLSSDREPYPKCPTPSLHFKEREKERQREREMHMFRHSVPPKLQSAQPSPTLTQSSYYTPAAGSMENKASVRRAVPSKELYVRLSSPNTAASVLSSNSTQSTVKCRPPPLVKRNTEREEGLLGKITEQLISKSISVDPQDVSGMERKCSSASIISVSSSSSSTSRVVPSLHRAPIFHPPALPTVTSKEAGQDGIPRSVLKDWRKVRKLKQSGEAFLQDDSCAEVGANVQKCRECRLDRSRKAQEPVISPVFCRFYYFRRLSFSKNGVVRVDGFSVVEDTDEEAVRVWVAGFEAEQNHKQKEMELDTAKYILTLIGDKFCQLVKTENTAVTWVKKETQVMWKRAVRGVREMCDACEATLFNIHWACHKCGFVVCMDCYKARERKSAKDKELYAWVRCVKNQPHDLKNLMPTQIVPERVLADLQSTMHSIRREYGIPSQCSCFGSSTFLSRSTITNGLLQLSERAQCDLKSQQQNQQKTTQNTAHKISTESRGKFERDDMETLGRKSSSPEQGSTLRDLLTSTAGKLRLGSTGPGIVFAPVYNSIDQTAQKARMPNLLDDIIASVVENKIPDSKMTKLGLNQDLLTEQKEELVLEEVKPIRIPLADPHIGVPHDWIGRHRLLWLKDHHHQGNQRLFKENWTQEQPVLVSGLHKSLNASLWKPEHFSREFSALHSDFYNCRDGSIINTCVKEFWDGFEDVSKRSKSAKGDPAVYRLKDWPSGEEFLALMPSRYEDVMRVLPVPEYTGPDGTLNLASRLPSFFIRPDLGPRLCCAHGVTACPEQDFGTSNLHVEISDTMSILVYVGVAKGNGALSKSGVLKLLEREDLDESAKQRLRDPNETPGALWHIYLSKDLHKIQEFLQTVAMERAEADAEADSEAEWESEADPLREGSWYLSPKLRQRLLEEHGVESRTLLQFYGDTVIIPAGALHQVMNLHSCIQVNVDFVSPEHAHNSYYLTQELRPLKDQVNYEDKLQVKNIFYHSVKDAVAALSRYLKEQSTEEMKEEEC